MSKVTVIDTLVKKADQIRSAADIILAKTADWQIIKQYLSNRVEKMNLTQDQQDKLARYQYIYNQLASGKYLETEIISQVVRLYSKGVTQAYEDLNSTRELFSTVVNINKLFELKIELESAKDMKRRAIEVGDFKGEGLARKAIAEVIKMLPDADENPAEMFQGHTIEATFDPRLLAGGIEITDGDMKDLLNSINSKRSVKIKTELFEELASENTDEPSQ